MSLGHFPSLSPLSLSPLSPLSYLNSSISADLSLSLPTWKQEDPARLPMLPALLRVEREDLDEREAEEVLLRMRAEAEDDEAAGGMAAVVVDEDEEC